MKRHLVLALIILRCAALPLVAQIPQLLLPEGNGAWLVQVATSGGILGTGGGDFAISSEGKIACRVEMKCPEQFPVSDFHPLVEVIQSGILPVPATPIVSLCNDCIKRTITIRRRDSMGVVQTYTASWDDTTKSKLPPEVIRIYDAVLALGK